MTPGLPHLQVIISEITHWSYPVIKPFGVEICHPNRGSRYKHGILCGSFFIRSCKHISHLFAFCSRQNAEEFSVKSLARTAVAFNFQSTLPLKPAQLPKEMLLFLGVAWFCYGMYVQMMSTDISSNFGTTRRFNLPKKWRLFTLQCFSPQTIFTPNKEWIKTPKKAARPALCNIHPWKLTLHWKIPIQ